MPLVKGSGQKVISANIAIERRAGKPAAQAEAIAYSEAKDAGKGSRNISRLLPADTKREYDQNGWAEILDNPLSKVGVFQYIGSTIDPDGTMGFDPAKIYNVFRSAAELSDPATLESFRLLPWTDEHAMLGSEAAGLMPAERKGVHGVIGEKVTFSDGYLRANIKVFSEKLARKIQEGKKQLSIGYRCKYIAETGVYDGTHYDAIQTELRGNHVALVAQGRSGPDVAVLDHSKMTLDFKEQAMPDENKEDSMDSLKKENMDLKEKMAARDKKDAEDALKKEAEDALKPDAFVTKANASENKESKESRDKKDSKDGYEEAANDKDMAKDKKEGMDSAIAMDAKFNSLSAEFADFRNNGEKLLLNRISRRDALVKKLAPAIGVFDHKELTLDEVEKYAVEKLKITCKAGHESSVLDGYLAAFRAPVAVAMDTMPQSDDITAYLKGSK